jgi:hypothetical protein
MRIGFISYHPPCPEGIDLDEVYRLREHALSLVEQGLQVLWLSSTATAEALRDDPTLVPDDMHSLPATCRYVIPCQPYCLAGIPFYCADTLLWQQRPFHTRLFTFLCLLQQALPSAVWHVWGDLTAAFLTVYTARFVGVPAVVSYNQTCFQAAPRHPFAWQWVARHASMALVTSLTDQERLISTSACPLGHIQVGHLAGASATSAMVTLYRKLHDPRCA